MRSTASGSPGPEQGPAWTKSSLSYCNSNCVEVAILAGGQIGVRDSKDHDRAILRFTSAEWEAFLGRVRNGEFEVADGSSCG